MDKLLISIKVLEGILNLWKDWLNAFLGYFQQSETNGKARRE